MQRIPGYHDLTLEGRVTFAALPESGLAFVQATQNHARQHPDHITGLTARNVLSGDKQIVVRGIGRLGRRLNLRPAAAIKRHMIGKGRNQKSLPQAGHA